MKMMHIAILVCLGMSICHNRTDKSYKHQTLKGDCVIFTSCSFVDITYGDDGAAVYHPTALKDKFVDCLFDRCRSTKTSSQGGAIFIGRKKSGSSLTVTRCCVVMCTAYHGQFIYQHLDVSHFSEISVYSCKGHDSAGKDSKGNLCWGSVLTARGVSVKLTLSI
jgi:hypothetical protein